MKKKKHRFKKNNKAIYIIPGLLILFSFFIFFGLIDFMPKAKTSFQSVSLNKNNPDFLYIVEMTFISNGSFIAGKPVDVEVKAFFNYNNPNNSNIKWDDVEIGIGGQECYVYKDKVAKGKKVNRMVKLNNFENPNIFTTKERVIFEQPGSQLIFSMLNINGNPAVINNNKMISIEERSVWLSVVENRITLSLSIIALSLTLVQIFRELF